MFGIRFRLPGSLSQASHRTFGCKESRAENVDIVQLKIKGKDDSSVIYVEAICIPEICAPLKNQNFNSASKKYKHLINLDFADCFDDEGSVTVDVLIGLDFYYSFLTGGIRRGREGPVAICSIFGWILSGTFDVTGNNETFVQLNYTHCLRVNTGVMNESGYNLNEVLNKVWKVDNSGIDNEVGSLATKFLLLRSPVYTIKNINRMPNDYTGSKWKRTNRKHATIYGIFFQKVRT